MKLIIKMAILAFSLTVLLGPTSVLICAQSNEPDTAPLQLVRKPKAAYTDSARKHNLQGTVKLMVTFLSTGEIGEIVDVTKKHRKKLAKLGLTQNAMLAARQIQFIPAKKNGVAVTVNRTVEYTFTIY